MLATSVSLFVSVSALALHHRAEGFAPHAAVSPRRRDVGGRIPPVVVPPDFDRHGDGGSSVAFVTSFALQASAGGGGGEDFASFASNLDPPPNSRSSRGSSAAATTAGWKDDLDELLGFSASPARRQVLLQNLLNSNQEIRDAVETALRERKVRRMRKDSPSLAPLPFASNVQHSLGIL